MAKTNTQRTQRIVHDGCRIGTEKDQVAIDHLCAFEDLSDDIIRQKLEDWGLQTIPTCSNLIYFDVGQSFSAVEFDKICVAVDLLSTDRATTGYSKSSDPRTRI